MNREFRRVVAAPFFMWQKGLLPPLLPLFYPKNKRRKRKIQEAEDDHTPKRGSGYEHTEPGKRTDRTKPADGQDTGCSLTGIRLQPAKTTVYP